jgi:hypothetical protein
LRSERDLVDVLHFGKVRGEDFVVVLRDGGCRQGLAVGAAVGILGEDDTIAEAVGAADSVVDAPRRRDAGNDDGLNALAIEDLAQAAVEERVVAMLARGGLTWLWGYGEVDLVRVSDGTPGRVLRLVEVLDDVDDERARVARSAEEAHGSRQDWRAVAVAH